MRRLAVLVALLLTAAPAAAHSLLLDASPAVNSVGAPPREIALRFNNRIEKRLSRIRLVNERGEARDLPVAVDGAADRLNAAVPGAAPGKYRVEWQVLSADGHVVSGRYSFTVK